MCTLQRMLLGRGKRINKIFIARLLFYSFPAVSSKQMSTPSEFYKPSHCQTILSDAIHRPTQLLSNLQHNIFYLDNVPLEEIQSLVSELETVSDNKECFQRQLCPILEILRSRINMMEYTIAHLDNDIMYAKFVITTLVSELEAGRIQISNKAQRLVVQNIYHQLERVI